MKNFLTCLSLCLGFLAFSLSVQAQTTSALQPIDISKGIDLKACQAKAPQTASCTKTAATPTSEDLDCQEEEKMAQAQCTPAQAPNCCIPPLCCKKGASVQNAATQQDQAPVVQAAEEMQPACQAKPKSAKAL